MSTQFPDDDPLATRLHDALDSEAAMVTPSDDGLQRIRAGVDGAHRPWWRHPAAIAVAAAVALGTAVGVGAAVFGHDDGGTVVATDATTGGGTPSDATSTPTATTASVQPEPQDPSITGSPRPAGDIVYVYWIGNDSGQSRLFREQVPYHGDGGAAAVSSALDVVTSGHASDPDYNTAWHGDALGYRRDGDTGVVLLDNAYASNWGSDIAVQELVYTVTANDPSVKQVQFLLRGKPAPPGSAPLTRAPMLDVQGLIWLLSPTEGATVASPVTISGYGTAFEGTISWEVRKMDKAVATDTKVAEGHTQGGSNGEFGDFHDTVDLPPGTYEIRAFESSPEDGSPRHVDTKTFTVQ
jgi:hypothetical protein